MSFNFGTPKTTGQPSMFSMSTPSNTLSGQPQMGLFGATTQSPAPTFSLPTSVPTFGISPSLPTSTPIMGPSAATTKPAFNLGNINPPSFSLGATPNFGLTTNPSTTVQPTIASTVKTSVPIGFALPSIPASQTPTTQASAGFTLGAAPTVSTGFSLGGTTQASSGFSLGSTSQASTGFSLSSTPTVSTSGFTSGSTTQASSGFSLGGTTQASTGFSLTSTTQPSTGFSLGSTPTVSTSGFSLGSTTQASTGFSLGSSGMTTTQTTTTQTIAITSQAPPTTSQPESQSNSAQPTNFQQLVDLINNWTVSLENQEKQFLNQANEITVWDNMLTNQSTKLVKLYDMLERKEKEQVDIENELDFLLSQQKELEDCLVPLEQELQSAEVLSTLNNEREPIYKAAQEIDNQVKQMSGDIKEIVNNLNKANSKKDSDDDLDTICRILNCHMTALQYIEHNTENLSSMVAEVNAEHSRFLTATNNSSFMTS